MTDNLTKEAPEINIQNSAYLSPQRILELFLLAISSIFALYSLYFWIAPWVTKQNIVYPENQLAPWIMTYLSDPDGIETYVLYIFMFINLLLTGLLFQTVKYLFQNRFLRGLLIACLTYCAWKFAVSVHFIPPMSESSQNGRIIGLWTLPLVVFLFLALWLQKRISRFWEVAFSITLLIPTCFIAYESASSPDYAFIFLPAQKLLSGVSISNIYFQYDLFLSFLALCWLKLGFNLWQFQFLGQASFFIAILSVYLFSQKLFNKKSTALLLLFALILIRLYSSPWDGTLCFQTTPIRLDLWLILFIGVFFAGPYHWSIGLLCGGLLLFHRNFGIIYSLAYIQMLLTFFAFALFNNLRGPNKIDKHEMFVDFRKVLISLSIIAICFALSQLLIGQSAATSSQYQKMSIGFMPISPTSFFWYYPIVLSAAFVLLCSLRNHITKQYLTLGFLLLYCTIGNSIYFFGRSHENNIFNISISLVFLFFCALDLIDRAINLAPTPTPQPSFWQKHGTTLIGILFITSAFCFYSNTISKKINVQASKPLSLPLQHQAKHIALDNDFAKALEEIKFITNNSALVQFFDVDPYSEFSFYYYGKYTNLAFTSPLSSAIFLDPLIKHLQKLLSEGYYLVIRSELYDLVLKKYLIQADKLHYAVDKKYIIIFSSIAARAHLNRETQTPTS